MARAPTTTDAFNAVAEPRRRQILDVLVSGELSVTGLAALLDLAQPQVSKHLKVLKEVGLVAVRDQGRERLYRLDARPLQPIHDWVGNFRLAWEARFQALDQLLVELKQEEERNDGNGE